MILSLLLMHFIFDWRLQSREIAENKSKSVKALLHHVKIYGCGLATFTICWQVSILWFVINLFVHFATDYVSSKISSHLYKNKEFTQFWNMIGLDQLIHYATLFGTLALFK